MSLAQTPSASAPLHSMQDGLRHVQPDFAGGQHARHLGGADAEHVGAERAPGGRMAVAADDEQARAYVALLGQHHVADPFLS